MRCNLLSPTDLTDRHLIAERLELSWIPSLLKKRTGMKVPLLQGVPDKYCLGTGHMLFWLNKMKYLDLRYEAITAEMETRGFKPNRALVFDVTLAKKLNLYNDWSPDQAALNIIIARIRERIELKRHLYRYYRVPITQEWLDSIYHVL